jgi:murein DD-endopeptidase MepM/ murein hydrolase activator NlpD
MNPIASDALVRVLDRIGQLESRSRQLESRARQLDRTWLGARLEPSVAVSMPIGATGRDRAVAAAPGSAVPGAGLTPVMAPAPEGFAAALSALGRPTTSRDARPVSEPADHRFVEPVMGAQTTQQFGPSDLASEPAATFGGVRFAHFHDGLDLAAPLGRPVVAAADGRVAFAGRTDDGAVVVRIVHADGSETRYGHLGAGLDVRAGDRVAAGDQIGVIGLTGNTTGPHLHFELWYEGEPVDPAKWIDAGRLPGLAGVTTSIGPADQLGAWAGDAAALARFDRVADRIPYASEIRAAAIDAGVDPLLLASLVRAESGFRADAISRAGAMGLTQLMPATAAGLHVDDPFDPAQNLSAGAKYLVGNLRIYGRVDLALAAYQAGKSAVREAGGVPDSATTRNYIATVLRIWSGYLEAVT